MNRVSTQFFKIGTPEEPLPLLESGSLNDADVAYQTWGDLNEMVNAIDFHALSGVNTSGLNPESNPWALVGRENAKPAGGMTLLA